MAYTLPIVMLLCGTVGSGLAYTGPDLMNVPYCGITKLCCANRVDSCSYPILGSVCYCDEFCMRGDHDDCCPDYEKECLNRTIPEVTTSPPIETTPVVTTLPPVETTPEVTTLPPVETPPETLSRCKLGDTTTDDCHTCICVSVNGENKLVCDEDPCIVSDDVIEGVRQADLGWSATNYTQFQGKKLQDALIYKLGTLPLSSETTHLGPISYDKDIPYPSHFDARTHWKNYISPIVDQGWCGSDWAVSIASIVSDRFAIQSNGAENVILSPQTLLSCDTQKQKGCLGGFVDSAWTFTKKYGLVDEDCLPYQAKYFDCPFKRRGNLRQSGCTPMVPQRTERYRVGPPGRLIKEADIMYDIMQSGPVQAVMTVYQDFFHYQGGIYRRSQFGNTELKGLHSIRIVGWGEENEQKYWIVANSWGTQWGENGYFRIARGVNESGIESFIVTVLTDVTEAYMRK